MTRLAPLLLALLMTSAAQAQGSLEPALRAAVAAAPSAPVRVIYFPRSTVDGPAGAAGMALDLRAAGQEVLYRSPLTGVVVARGPAASIARAAADPRIRAVYLERTYAPRLATSKIVTQAATLHGRGIDGTGSRIGIVEAGRIGGHPRLPQGRRILCQPGVAGAVSVHKTEVAGVVQSTDPQNTGMAPGTVLVDGNAATFSDSALIAATDCVVARGVVAVSMSFGADTDGIFTAFADYLDELVYRTGVTVVVAVSNDCSLRMGSPEIAYNDISVGAFSDRGTRSLGDDRQACDPAIEPQFSAWRDPPSANGDREQPDVVAPGDRIATTVPPGSFEAVSGTSFAAPHVAGEIALLQDRAGFSLARQAERVRAIVMASARHNIEGGAGLSDRDGAGAVRFAAAAAVLRLGQSWWFKTSGGRNGFPREQAFDAPRGRLVRVALAWAHKPGSGHARASTNLDLAVLDPAGRVVASSALKDNNAEIVAFRTAAAGRYRIRITNLRPSPGAEHVGLAVSQLDD